MLTKKTVMASLLLVLVCSNTFAKESTTPLHVHQDRSKEVDCRDLINCDDCCSQLNLAKLCVKSLKSRCVEATRIKAQDISTDQLTADTICTNKLNVSETICARSVDSTLMCTERLTANNACIPGVLTVNQLEECGVFRATTVLSNDILYTLGDPLPLNVIVDDPNGNVSVVPFFSYIAPRSGYYAFSLHVQQHDFQPTNGPILGIPVALPQLLVNGIPCHHIFSPFLAFHNSQSAICSGLISLQVGDLVTTRYRVFTLSDLGFIDTPGTVILDGNGTERETSFKIHLLSIDCQDEQPCPPCQPCNIPCSISDTPCEDPCASCPCPPGCVPDPNAARTPRTANNRK